MPTTLLPKPRTDTAMISTSLYSALTPGSDFMNSPTFPSSTNSFSPGAATSLMFEANRCSLVAMVSRSAAPLTVNLSSVTTPPVVS